MPVWYGALHQPRHTMETTMTSLDASSPFNEAEAQTTAARMVVVRGSTQAAIDNALKHANGKRTEASLRPFWNRVAEILGHTA